MLEFVARIKQRLSRNSEIGKLENATKVADQTANHAENGPHDLIRQACLASARTLSVIPVLPSDERLLDKIVAIRRPCSADECPSFFAAAERANGGMTPGLWRIYILEVVKQWANESAQESAAILPALRTMHPSTGDEDANELLDAVASTISVLSFAAFDPTGPEAARSPSELLDLSRKVSVAQPDHAFDLAVLALELTDETAELREECALFALQLAIEADRIHQIAACTVALAGVAIRKAKRDPRLRLAAFDACEIASERIVAAPEPFRTVFARHLGANVGDDPELRLALLSLVAITPEEVLQNASAKFVGVKWPARISHGDQDGGTANVKAVFALQEVDALVEQARLSMEAPQEASFAQTDWISWAIEHPAYRRAIPHIRSFLRESNFDELVLVLTHELTHVLSFVGGIGMAAACLRTALLHEELGLWSTVEEQRHEALLKQIAEHGVAPLHALNAASLIAAERALDLSLKQQALQDVWTPWLEGLAVFGEIAADPAKDPTSISEVTAALRNMVDFHPGSDENGKLPELSEQRLAFEQFVAEFEQRCSAAVTNRAPRRLDAYVREPSRLYFSGFLSVRAVVASWRSRLDEQITGPDAFSLLLHATRYGTFDAIPSLDLEPEAFRTAALDSMIRWARKLAGVPAAELVEFFKPIPRDEPGRPFHWSSGSLCLSDDNWDTEKEASRRIATRAREAFAGVSTSDDADDVVHSASQTIKALLTLSTFLPIGRTAAKFQINRGPHNYYLWLQLRTTESHMESRAPSINVMAIPIDQESVGKIERHYRETGVPRVNVFRVIDVSQSVLPETKLVGVHFLAFQYGDWFQIMGATQAQNALMQNDAEHLAYLKSLAKRRVCPSALALTEENVIARGLAGAKRTLAWLDDAAPVPSTIRGWIANVRAKAERTLENVQRHRLTMRTAETLFSELVGDQQLAEAVVNNTFGAFVDVAAHREKFVELLFQTSSSAIDDAWLDQNSDAFGELSARVFQKRRGKWDVKAAV